jgi:hypothetical protein
MRVAGVRKAWEESAGGLTARASVLDLEGSVPIPVVELVVTAASGSPRVPLAVAFADGGRQALAERAAEILRGGSRVLLLDPALLGENVPRAFAPWAGAMMLAAAGERPLGVMVSQVLAVASWARAEWNPAEVLLLGSGTTSSAAALLAAAFDRDVKTVAAEGLLPSLKVLIEEGADYHRSPALFAFGLLEALDVREMVALCAPRAVCVAAAGDRRGRMEEEMRGLDAVFRAFGGAGPSGNFAPLPDRRQGPAGKCPEVSRHLRGGAARAEEGARRGPPGHPQR